MVNCGTAAVTWSDVLTNHCRAAYCITHFAQTATAFTWGTYLKVNEDLMVKNSALINASHTICNVISINTTMCRDYRKYTVSDTLICFDKLKLLNSKHHVVVIGMTKYRKGPQRVAASRK